MDKGKISRCKFGGLTPILNVKNIPESINYYVNVLGFKKDWEWGEPPNFASVSRDEICIFLCQEGQGRSGTWLSIFVDNVDLQITKLKSLLPKLTLIGD